MNDYKLKNDNRMVITNWLKAGKNSKKNIKIAANIHCNPKGACCGSKWDDYVQFKFFSKEKMSFIRLTMTLDEAKYFQKTLNDKMHIFNSTTK